MEDCCARIFFCCIYIRWQFLIFFLDQGVDQPRWVGVCSKAFEAWISQYRAKIKLSVLMSRPIYRFPTKPWWKPTSALAKAKLKWKKKQWNLENESYQSWYLDLCKFCHLTLAQKMWNVAQKALINLRRT